MPKPNPRKAAVLALRQARDRITKAIDLLEDAGPDEPQARRKVEAAYTLLGQARGDAREAERQVNAILRVPEGGGPHVPKVR